MKYEYTKFDFWGFGFVSLMIGLAWGIGAGFILWRLV